MRFPSARPAALLLLVSLLAGACSSSDDSETASSGTAPVALTADDGGRPVVFASFYPLEEVTRSIGGDSVEVRSLTPVGVSPHGLELTAKDLEGLESSRALFYLGRGFQPAVEKAVSSLPESVVRVDLLANAEMLPIDAPVAGVEGEVDGEVLEGNVDPHVWVDPVHFSEIASEIEAALISLVPDDAEAIAARAATYKASLEALDGEFRSGLAACESKAIVTSHRAFGYLANRYGLEQLPIAGISPDEEPSPKSLEAVAAAAKEKGVTVIFFESLVPKELSETVAKEIGATTDALDPIEGLTKEDLDAGVTYESIQRKNLASLRTGLRCS